MLLTSPEIKIADTDIPCIKVCQMIKDKFYGTVFSNFKYNVGEITLPELKVVTRPAILAETDPNFLFTHYAVFGLSSFGEEIKGVFQSNVVRFEAIIPEGTAYVKGYDYLYGDMYMSNAIKLIKIKEN